MIRARYAALALGALLAGPAHAVDVPRPTPPPDRVDVVEPHRFSPIVQGIVGATGGAFIIAGVGVTSASYRDYEVALSGRRGVVPSVQLAPAPRAARGVRLGLALIGVGAALLVTTAVLAKLDWDYRNDHMRTAKVRITPTGVTF